MTKNQHEKAAKHPLVFVSHYFPPSPLCFCLQTRRLGFVQQAVKQANRSKRGSGVSRRVQLSPTDIQLASLTKIRRESHSTCVKVPFVLVIKIKLSSILNNVIMVIFNGDYRQHYICTMTVHIHYHV